jgi:hypothetical protein
MLLQPFAIGAWVEKPVDVIDPQALDIASFDQVEY